MIGRQWLLVAPEVVADVARFYDLAIPPRPPAQSYAEPFFAMLGAKRIDSLDFSTFEGAKKVTPENPPSKPQ